MDNNQEIKTDIVVIYHGKCMDGFTGAWVAYKKFGNTATYIGAEDRTVPPAGLLDKEIYIIDYSYPVDVLLDLESKNKKLVVLDHHVSAKDTVTAVKDHVYDVDHSGAYIAWKYFFQDTPIPKFVLYVEDGDLYRFKMPFAKSILSYVYMQELHFERFDLFEQEFENQDSFTMLNTYGQILLDAHMREISYFALRAEKVLFEGYEIYACNATKKVASDLGHILAEKTNTCALIYYYDDGKMKCSLRSVGEFDVSVLAAKYGGGGHKNASGFAIKVDNHPLSCVTLLLDK
jgi:oligoribonuclease NrnB/cAMP/cGMP phosphodiesterase (DHH superfamily)